MELIISICGILVNLMLNSRLSLIVLILYSLYKEVKLTYHRCLLLYSQNKLEDFLADGVKLLAQYMADVYYDESLKCKLQRI